MKQVTFRKEVTLKANGRVIPVGTVATVEFKTEKVQGIERDFMQITLDDGETYRSTKYSVFFKLPSIRSLQNWSNDSICKSVTGKRVELDGHGDDNSPSWLLALGWV